MADAAQGQATESDVNRGFADIDAGLVIAHEPAPPYHPAEGSFDYAAPEQGLDARLDAGRPLVQ